MTETIVGAVGGGPSVSFKYTTNTYTGTPKKALGATLCWCDTVLRHYVSFVSINIDVHSLAWLNRTSLLQGVGLLVSLDLFFKASLINLFSKVQSIQSSKLCFEFCQYLLCCNLRLLCNKEGTVRFCGTYKDFVVTFFDKWLFNSIIFARFMSEEKNKSMQDDGTLVWVGLAIIWL